MYLLGKKHQEDVSEQWIRKRDTTGLQDQGKWQGQDKKPERCMRTNEMLCPSLNDHNKDIQTGSIIKNLKNEEIRDREKTGNPYRPGLTKVFSTVE